MKMATKTLEKEINFPRIQSGNTYDRVPALVKLQTWRTQQVYPGKFWKIFQVCFFTEHLQKTASVRQAAKHKIPNGNVLKIFRHTLK